MLFYLFPSPVFTFLFRPAFRTAFVAGCKEFSCGNQIFTYISIFVDALLWCFFLFVSGKCNFVRFVLVMNDMLYGYEHMRISMSMRLRVYDNTCHKMHVIIVEICGENLQK